MVRFKYFLPLLILAACTGSQQADEIPAPLFPEPKIVAVNPAVSQIVNPVTGDTIQPLINALGDTIITGVAFPVSGKVIHPESVEKPKITPVINPDSSFNAHANVHEIPKELKVIPVNKDALTIIFFEGISDGDTTHHLSNSSGAIVKTGVPITARGKKVASKHPQPSPAFSPAFKDVSIANIQFLDVDQGLNSSYVRAVLQDKNGNIWIGTYGGGVSKYDGKTFMNYTVNEGLTDNNVSALLEDRNGNLWIGTKSGLNMYNGESFYHFTEKEGLTNNNISTIFEDKNGGLWIGTWGGGVSLYSGENFVHYTENEGLSNNIVLSIVEDKSGELWFGTNGGGVNKFDGNSFTHYSNEEGLSNNMVLAALEDKNGNLWFGTWGGGISMYNGETFTHYTDNEGLSNNYVRAIVEDKKGNIWFGTHGAGVNMYDGKTFTHFTEKEGLSNNYIRTILEDNSGSLWFGTNGGGINKYSSESFIHYTQKEGLSNNIILSVLEDKNGNLWFGTNGSGVIKYDGKSFTHYSEKEGLSKNIVYSIAEDKIGNIWFGTWGGGVSKYNSETFVHYTENEGLSNNFIRAILEDKNGNLWFASHGGGVSKYDGSTFVHYTEKEGLSNNIVYSILEDKNENLWFGTHGGGVSKFDGETLTHYTEKEGLSSNYVLSMLEDKNGNLWFGTDGGGISMFNGKAFMHLTEKEGLSNNIVYSILEDKNSKLWFGTLEGLSYFDANMNSIDHKTNENEKHKIPSSKQMPILSFVKSDGLKGLDFFTNSAYIDSKNRAWWGVGKGLEMLDLNNFKISEKPPVVHLKQLEINEDFIDYRNIINGSDGGITFNGVQRFENYPLNLTLSHDKNHLTFHFVGHDWSAPHKILYSYIMEGLNSNWSQPSNEPKADYRNLPYGSYTFKVRAIGESGNWGDSFNYTFTITPPWWHTWWARLLYVLGASLLVLSYVKWRTTKLKERQKELEKEVEVATKEIRQQKEEVEKQKEIVELAHKEITDSIQYAKRIQSAILPPQKLVKQYLPESFIIYKPKDVVAGDFYWIEHKDNKILFAAADCTGHGVPGAMVSVICNNGLNRSVHEHGLTEPGEILNKTREIVTREFEKSENEVKDGMDVSLCALEGTNLKWAGANNPIWIIRNGEIIEIKPDKQAIGKVDNPKPYTTHQFKLELGDSIYIFTDGFQDQFGGESQKKFKSANFKKLLLSVQSESMEKQREIIDAAFEGWRGNFDQIDDVCVIGLRIM